MKKIVFVWGCLVAVLISLTVKADDGLWERFSNPSDEARTKLWWFHGETETTKEGIDADLEAFKKAGVGGVVFYDQVHGAADGAFDSMSPQWWEMLKYAACKARELGLSFEVAASNGYVAGGPWITPRLGMQKVAAVDTLISVSTPMKMCLPLQHPDSNFTQIAVLMFPDSPDLSEITMLSERLTASDNQPLLIDFDAGKEIAVSAVSYVTNPRGKGSTGSMNIPGAPRERYFGAMYVELPPIGTLEYSREGTVWEKAASLPAIENVIGHKSRERTVSFPEVKGRYFRLNLSDWMDSAGMFGNLQIENVRLSPRDLIDNWQVKSGLRTEVSYPRAVGADKGSISMADIVDISSKADSDGTIELEVPAGTWRVVRFGHIPTYSRTKHGRRNLLGLEADVMSAEGATVHYDNYFKAICDSLAAAGCKPSGMCMDSHEAEIQNWTPGFEKIFEAKHGYSLIPRLPVLAGYIVADREASEKVLADFRRTIAETIAENFYGTFARLCHEDSVCFTSQAMLNIDADNILSRSKADKPQGEFWAYQTNGNYDCLDAASAAHLYGHPIASGEAFTDTPYERTWDELLRIANLAYCRGINEFAVCASSYQPWAARKYDDSASAHPYIFHRLNPAWPSSPPFWEYQARCASLLREGEPVVDLCIFIGEDLPAKTFAYRLPEIPEGYNFDVCTLDALMNRISHADGQVAVEGGMRYRALVVQDRSLISSEALERIGQLEREGLPVVRCDKGEVLAERLKQLDISPDLAVASASQPDDRIAFFHRRASDCDIYFIYNHSDRPFDGPAHFRSGGGHVERWNPCTLAREEISLSADKSLTLRLAPYESCFIILR